jgi:hypothetical protein
MGYVAVNWWFLMGFNDTNPGQAVRGGEEETLSFSARLITQGRYAAAFKLLLPLRSAETALPPDLCPSLYVNYALCLIAAEEHAQAVTELEKALEAQKRLVPAGLSPGPAVVSAEHTATWQKLRNAEMLNGACIRPFLPGYPRKFPREAREDIIATLIGVCERYGMEEKARTLRAALAGPEFEEYKRRRR